MPVYCYLCVPCRHPLEVFQHGFDREVPDCPQCGKPMQKDFAAESPHTDLEYHKPLVSVAAGVHPAQVPEIQRKHPHHEFDRNGDMIFRSHRHRERCLKDIGLVDKG